MLDCSIRLHDAIKGLKHDPRRGWPLNFPEINNNSLNLHFKDDFTYYLNRIIEIERYKSFYKENINKITFYTEHHGIKDYFKKSKNLNFVFYPKFLFEQARSMNKFKKIIESMFHFKKKTKKFLCLNRQVRTHRDAVVSRVKNLSNAVYSYIDRGIYISEHDKSNINDYGKVPPWGENGPLTDSLKEETFHPIYPNFKNFLSMAELFNNTSFSLITETRYNLPFDFITEKTVHSWISLHPALYVSNRLHVKTLRDWGFDVFDDVFDHGYDNYRDDKRIKILFKANEKQLNEGINIDEILEKRLIKNRNHYFNNFPSILLELSKLSH